MFAAKIADELDAAPPGSAWPQFVVDSVQLRDQVRACKGVAFK